MKHFIVAIVLSVTFSALLNAEQPKIAYERGEKIIQKENEDQASIYRLWSVDGKNPKLLVKHARTPTASAP
jgi:hypothetical protein